MIHILESVYVQRIPHGTRRPTSEDAWWERMAGWLRFSHSSAEAAGAWQVSGHPDEVEGDSGQKQLLRSPEGPAVWLWHLGLPTHGRWPTASCGELSQQVARHQEAGSSPAPSLSRFPPLRIPDLQPSMLSSPGHENSFGVAGISACRPIHFAPEIVISSSSDVR